jgi:nucleotide-binding universal stress UspA family protein
MRWIIGVDLGKRTRGALRFAGWLGEAMGESGRDAFVPVHVLHEEHLRMMLRYRRLDDLVEAERSRVSREIADVMGRRDLLPEVVQAITVGDGLESARARHRAAGVIVARAAPTGSRRMFRLGGVARRLLRRLASPVIVVPPDLATSSIGAGPVVSLSSLEADSVAACRLARSIADAARRDLSLVHVEDERHHGSARRGSPTLREVSAGPFAHRERALARWVARHGVWPDVATVVEGESPAAAAVRFAEARRAPLVVVGAHCSTGLRSELEPKLWRWLAAHARQAVLVVPAAPAAVERLGAPSWAADDVRP